jgi:manganese/zinc/iron transport system permease protein
MTLLADAYPQLHIAAWTIIVAGVCGVSCALLGAFLLLKRMSLLGDAISHGILPGIALSVLLSGKLYGPFLLAGAVLFGFLTAFLAQALHSYGKVTEDASLGVVFTSLFALGIILITGFLHHVDLDPQCIFYGLLDFVSIRTDDWFGFEIPKVFPTQLVALVLTVAFICLFWKELKIATFDPGLAGAMGYRPNLLHFAVIGLVAGNTVSAFEAVGSILVLAMLIVPPATALFFTDRLAPLLWLSAAFAFSSAVFAFFLASPRVLASNMAGMMAVVSGAQFGLALFFAPRHGLLVRYVRQLRLGLRIATDEVLASLYRTEEGAPTALEAELRLHGVSSILTKVAFWQMRRHRLMERENGSFRLTALGRNRAEEVVRAHRLWEAYLEKNFDLPADHLHEPASRIEHFIGPALSGDLARELDQPATDPHGRTIPREKKQSDEGAAGRSATP